MYILIRITGEYSGMDWQICSVYDDKKTALKNMYSLLKEYPEEYQIQEHEINHLPYGPGDESIIVDHVYFIHVQQLKNFNNVIDQVIKEFESSEKSETLEKLLQYEKHLQLTSYNQYQYIEKISEYEDSFVIRK